MKQALIFAAGLGTRLRPLTDRCPKALVDVGGRTMLEHVALSLVDVGVERIVVNVHPFAERIERFVLEREGFGVDVRLSHEVDRPLETGGGLRHAARHLDAGAPCFLHNVDVLTDLPLDALYEAHRTHDPIATLAVMARPSQRFLLFDDHGLLGRVDETKDLELRVRDAVGPVRRLAFSGVHVVAPRLPSRLEEEGAFSILVPYLRLAATGERILPFRVDGCRWIDVGRPEQLEAARGARRPPG